MAHAVVTTRWGVDHRLSLRAEAGHAHVGHGRRRGGAHAGVLIKDAAAIERMEKVDTLVVDKTGTLTEGKPRLTQVVPTHPVSEEELLRAEAAIEAT
jgi:cation transport ATPase